MSFVDEDLPKREAIRRPNKKISKKKKLTSLFKSCEWLLNMPVIDENGELGSVSFKSERRETIKTNNYKELSKGFDIAFSDLGRFTDLKRPITAELLNSTSRQLYKIKRILERSETLPGYYKQIFNKYNSRYFYLREALKIAGGFKLKTISSDIQNQRREDLNIIFDLLHLEAFTDYRFVFSPAEFIRVNLKTARHLIIDFIKDENNSVYCRMIACSIALREGLNLKYEGENKDIIQVIKAIISTRNKDYDNFIIKLIILGCSLEKVLKIAELLNAYGTNKNILGLFFQILLRLKYPDYFVEFLCGFYIRLLEINPENSYYDFYMEKVEYNENYLEKCSKQFKVSFDIVKKQNDPAIVDILFSHININQLKSIQKDGIYASGIASQYYENHEPLRCILLMLYEDFHQFNYDCSGLLPKLNFLYKTSVLKLVYLLKYEYFLSAVLNKPHDFHSILEFIVWKDENIEILNRIEHLFKFLESQKIIYTIFRCSKDLQETSFFINLFKFNPFAKDTFYSDLSGFLFMYPERFSDLSEKYFYAVKSIRSNEKEAGQSEKADLVLFLTGIIRNIPETIQDKFLDLILKGYKSLHFSLNEFIKFTREKNTWINKYWAENLLDVLAGSSRKDTFAWLREDCTTSFLNNLFVLNNEDPGAFMAYLINRMNPADLENENYHLVLDISPFNPRIYLDLIKFIEREDLYVYQIAPIRKIAVSLAENPAGLKKFSLILREDPKRWFRVFTPMGFLLDIKPGFLSTLIDNMFREYKEIDLSETILKDFSDDPLISSLISELKFYLSEIEHVSDLPASLVEAAEIEKYYSDQLNYIRSRLKEPGKTDQVYKGLMNKRKKIEAKLADPLSLGKERRSLVIKKAKDLINEYMQSYIAKIFDEFIQEVSRRYRLRDIKSLQGKIEVGDLLNALKISIEIEYNKKFAIKLIGKYIKGKKNYFDSHPENLAFIKKVRLIGVDTDAWMSGFSKSYDNLILGIENDPIKVLQMGNYFDTCLSQGKSNAYSAVTNVIEVNKKVIYARDMHGKVVGRKLIGMTDKGSIVGYKTYSYANALDLKKIFDEFCIELSQICNTRLINTSKPALLFADQWYEDHIEPFPWVTFKVITRLFEQYKNTGKLDFLTKALRIMYKLNHSNYAVQAIDLLLKLEINEYNPRINYMIFRAFCEMPSDRLFLFITEKEERNILRFGKITEDFFNPYNLAKVSADIVVPFFIKHAEDIPGIDKVFKKYASFAEEKVLVWLDNTYSWFDNFPFDLSDSFGEFLQNPPSASISESNLCSIFRKLIRCRKYDHLFELKFNYLKNELLMTEINQILESSDTGIQDVINCFRYLLIINEKPAQKYVEKYFNMASGMNTFFLDYIFITSSYEYFRLFESETILKWINDHVKEFETLMRQDAKTFYDNFLNNRPVILALLDHVLGSHATSAQKLDSIRTFAESAGNIEKCKEVVEFIKSKASQNVYYRKAYQILKEKGL